MPTATANRRKRTDQPALFDNRPLTKPARTPHYVIKALVEEYGVPLKTAKGYPANVAFAIYYRYKNGAPIDPEKRKGLTLDVSRRMREAVSNSDFHSRELGDLVCEAVSLLDRDLLARVCAGLANLIDTETR